MGDFEPPCKIAKLPPSVVDSAPCDERQRTLILRGTVDAFTADKTKFVSRAHRVRGMRWYIQLEKIYKRTDESGLTEAVLGVFLHLHHEVEFAKCAVKFEIRLLSTDIWSTPPTFELRHEFETDPLLSKSWGRLCVVRWADLIDASKGFLDDEGRFVVEVDVIPDEPRYALARQTWPHHKSVSFAHRLYPDMTVGVEGEDGVVSCNKIVVCRHSEVIRRAMDNTSTKESASAHFAFSLDCATLENVTLFIRAMYDEWDRLTMDEHAVEIYRLAHCYESDRVAFLAQQAIKRTLAAKTFWAILQLAVDLSHEELIKWCASFADRGNFWVLLNRSDGQAAIGGDNVNNPACNVLLLAMAKRHEGEEWSNWNTSGLEDETTEGN